MSFFKLHNNHKRVKAEIIWLARQQKMSPYMYVISCTCLLFNFIITQHKTLSKQKKWVQIQTKLYENIV